MAKVVKRTQYTPPSYESQKTTMSGGNLTPRIISTFFLLALQRYFLSHTEYTWSKNDNETQIDIHPDYEEDDNMEKSVPVVVVQNGPVQITPAGVGTGMAYMSPRIMKFGDNVTTLDAFLDSQLQMTISSSIILTISGMSTDDVNELSFEIGMFLQTIRYSAASTLQIQNLGDIQISPAQASGKVGWSNRYMAQVSLSYSFTVSRVWKPVNYGELMREAITTVQSKVIGSKSDKKVLIPDGRMYQPRDLIPERINTGTDPLEEKSDIIYEET